MTVIRKANFDTDALSIVEGARDFADRTGMKSLFPKDDKAFTAAIGRIMTLEGMEILVAEHEKHIVGGIGILYAPFLWNPEILVGDELFWWTARDAPFRAGRHLIDEAMKHINEKGAIPMFRSLATSPDGVEKLYRRIGLSRVETAFARL